jgi:hypothetical protein
MDAPLADFRIIAGIITEVNEEQFNTTAEFSALPGKKFKFSDRILHRKNIELELPIWASIDNFGALIKFSQTAENMIKQRVSI